MRTEIEERDRKRHFALQNREENEKGYRRYVRLIAEGILEDEAREEVKAVFKWGDRRLDKVLETRAGAFAPKTVAELEAKALVYIRRLDNCIGALCRHCDKQLDRLADMDDVDKDGEPKWVSVELIEETSNKDFKTRKKKMTVADAIRVLGEAKLSYNQKFGDGLKAFKVDTIININQGRDIGNLSADELEIQIAKQKEARQGRAIDAEYTTTD